MGTPMAVINKPKKHRDLLQVISVLSEARRRSQSGRVGKKLSCWLSLTTSRLMEMIVSDGLTMTMEFDVYQLFSNLWIQVFQGKMLEIVYDCHRWAVGTS